MQMKSNQSSLSKKIDLGERGTYHINNKVNNLTGKEWVKFTKSWFILNPKARKTETSLHPAKFPEELVTEFVSFFTKEEDIIFDPFLGTGSALVGAEEIKRKGLGIELNEKYSKIAKSRISEDQVVITGNSSEIETKLAKKIKIALKKLNRDEVDFIITSPPYWDMLRKSRGNIESAQKKHLKKGGDEYYSDDMNDLGNITDYETYLNDMTEIFRQSANLLKSKGYFVIVIQNIRVASGEMVPVAWDIARKFSKYLTLKQERLWLQNNKRLNCWGYPSTYVSNVHHHYCLIFQKD
jgi:DNA modification methylase